MAAKGQDEASVEGPLLKAVPNGWLCRACDLQKSPTAYLLTEDIRVRRFSLPSMMELRQSLTNLEDALPRILFES